MIPADILIMKSSAANGFCYLHTSSLDGETGLKPREAIVRFQSFIRTEADLIKIKGDILVDEPNENIYSINGSITMDTSEKIYFSVTNTLLRVNFIFLFKYLFIYLFCKYFFKFCFVINFLSRLIYCFTLHN